MPGTGWGRQAWGRGPWGGIQATISIVNAFALGESVVRVTLSRSPLMATGLTVGSVFNPASWTVSRLDTGEQFNVVAIVEAQSPNIFDVHILEQFGPSLIMHRVIAAALLAGNGSRITIDNSFDFEGAVAAEPRQHSPHVISGRRGNRDFRYVSVVNLDGSDGTLRIGDHGDYENQSGPELLKKLITRRLLARKGDFNFMPDYGLSGGLKESIGDLAALNAEAKEQILTEPDVASVLTSMEYDPAGILKILIQAKTKSGQDVDFSVEASTN